MASQEQPTTVVAILGSGTLAEDVLEHLLGERGYSIRLLDAHPTGLIDELLEGVDVVLVAPGLDEGVREAFLEAMSTSPRTSALPVLKISPALKKALLDQQAVESPWQSLFEELLKEIEQAALQAAPERAAEPASPPAEASTADRPLLRTTEGTDPPRREPRLPAGYHLDRSDPDVLVLMGSEGRVVARFSARGATKEDVEREALERSRERRSRSA